MIFHNQCKDSKGKSKVNHNLVNSKKTKNKKDYTF